MPAMNPGTSPRAVSLISLSSAVSLTSLPPSGTSRALASRSDVGGGQSRYSRCDGSATINDMRTPPVNPLPPAVAKGDLGAGKAGASSSLQPMCCSVLALARVGDERDGLPMSERGGPLLRTEAPPASSGSCWDKTIVSSDLGVGILLGRIPGIPARRPPCPHSTNNLFSTTIRVSLWRNGRGRPASLGKELALGEAWTSHFLSSVPPHRFSRLNGSRAAAQATATA